MCVRAFFKGWEKLEKQISLLPRINYNLLSYVCRWVGAAAQSILGHNSMIVSDSCVPFLSRFLFEVQQHSAVNKMNVENLATVMGINLLKPQIEDPITVMKGENTLLTHIP